MSRRLVRPTGLLAEYAALETERDDALLRAERAELREAELEQRIEELEALRDRWQAATNAKGLDELVAAEARGYHDSACIYQEALAEKDAEIAELRAALKGDLGIFERRDQ